MRALFIVLAMCAVANADSTEESFATRTGDTWTYRADVAWTVENVGTVKHATVQWKTTIVDVIEGKNGRGIIVRGFPMHLAWYDPAQSEQDALDVVLIRPDGLWLAPARDEADAREIATQTADGAPFGNQLLRFPLKSGDCLVNPDIPESSNSRYCWLLMAKPSQTEPRRWELSYTTTPDDQTLIFTEAGITEYTYNHHGAIASAHAVLIKRTHSAVKTKARSASGRS